MKRLPSVTFCWSATERFGSPITWLSDLRGGGPGWRSLAREKLWHGVPRCPARTRPARSHPAIRHLLWRRRRSYSSPRLMSQSRTGQWLSLWIALPNRPAPQKNSKKTAAFKDAWGLKAPTQVVRWCPLPLECWRVGLFWEDFRKVGPVLPPSDTFLQRLDFSNDPGVELQWCPETCCGNRERLPHVWTCKHVLFQGSEVAVRL